MALIFYPRRDTLTGLLRGHETAKHLRAMVNDPYPKKDDVCVWVKARPVHDAINYIDLVDNSRYIDVLKKNPHFKAIAISQVGYEHLKNSVKNEVVFIPHYHCNYERAQRTRKRVEIAGFIGEDVTFIKYRQIIAQKLRNIGINLLVCHDYHSRQDVVDFYKKIDVQIVWRDIMGENWGKWNIPELRNPLKLSNAGSFGIPTVAFPEPCFEAEYKHCFIEALSIDDLVDSVRMLYAAPNLYESMSILSRNRSERYHIDRIANLYRELN